MMIKFCWDNREEGEVELKVPVSEKKNVLLPYKHSLRRSNKIVIVGPFYVVTIFDTVRVNPQ